MDIDKINDIETLRNLVKYFLTECKHDYAYNDRKLEKGNWYSLHQDGGGVDVYLVKANCITEYILSIDYDIAREIFK